MGMASSGDFHLPAVQQLRGSYGRGVPPALLGALPAQSGGSADLGPGGTAGAGELHLVGDPLLEVA